MKLVEIKDVRPGQIRKVTAYNNKADEFQAFAVIEMSGIGDYAEYDTYAEFYDAETKRYLNDAEELSFYENGELIGFLGITHEIKDNKLVEIPRKDIEVDDIFYRYRDNPQIVTEVNGVNSLTGYSPKEKRLIDHVANICYKIGILGVTHEFVNERL